MKNRSAITLLFIANIVSGCAQGISMLSIPWYFAKIHQSTFYGEMFIVITIISLFWGFYAGSLIDRFDRKHLFIVMNIVGLVVLGSVSTYGHIQGGLGKWPVAGIFATTILFYNIHFPSYYAFAQEITERSYYHKINSWLEIQNQFMFVLSGAIAAILLEGTTGSEISVFGFKLHTGIIIQPWKIHEIFTIDAITYVVAIAIISLIKYVPVNPHQREEGSLKKRLLSGITYLNNNRGILVFGISSYTVFATVLVCSYFLLPRFVRDHLQGQGDVFATGEMFFALGAMTTGAILSSVLKQVKYIQGLLFLMGFTILLYLLLFFSDELWVFYLAYFLIGFANSGIRILRITYLFRIVPNNIIGRTGSILSMMNVLMRLGLTLILLIPFFHIPEKVQYGMLVFAGLILIGMGGLVIYAINFKAQVKNAYAET